jgi:hypothetical protein
MVSTVSFLFSHETATNQKYNILCSSRVKKVTRFKKNKLNVLNVFEICETENSALFSLENLLKKIVSRVVTK